MANFVLLSDFYHWLKFSCLFCAIYLQLWPLFICICISAYLYMYMRVVLFFFYHLLSIWPHLFRGAGHEKRRGEKMKWSLAFRLYIGRFPCAQLPGPVHTARFGRVCFIFSLGLYFVCLYCFNLFLCSHPFVFPWADESSPLQFLALA